ncbi:hypothetical protein KCP69_17955 [Salmonella enterica subsp. enterica]|nr:hypothetical protein KCP69_17955 [Salmonella enterica subsp. enterica]
MRSRWRNFRKVGVGAAGRHGGWKAYPMSGAGTGANQLSTTRTTSNE